MVRAPWSRGNADYYRMGTCFKKTIVEWFAGWAC